MKVNDGYKVKYDVKLSLQEAEGYQELFNKHYAPSVSKAAIIADIVTSVPNINSNAMGFTSATLKNSYPTMQTVPINMEHDQSIIVGDVISPFLIEEEQNTILRIAGVCWKKALRYWGIDDLSLAQWSMECFHTDYCFYTKSKGIVEKENAPVDWVEKLDYWDYGKEVIDADTGERVALLLGGSNGTVEFSGLAVTGRPADKTSLTLYQAANEKKGGHVEVTEQELELKIKEAVASAIAEKDKTIVELQGKVKELSDTITSHEAKASEYETKVGELTQRAELSEGKLKDITIKNRKEILASKNVPNDLIEKKASFIADANDEQFNDYVAEVEVFASTFGKKEVTASDKGNGLDVIPNLTGGNDKDNDKNLSDVGFLL